MIVNGLFSATGWSQLGIDFTGTNADETNVSGKRIVKPYAFAASGEDAASPTKAKTHEKQYPIRSSSAIPATIVAEPGLEREADQQPHAQHHDELHDVRAHVGERAAREDGRARHRQRAEAVHQPFLQVLRQPERGDEAAEGHGLHDDSRDQEVDVAEPRCRDGAAEDVDEEQHEHQRLHGEADQQVGLARDALGAPHGEHPHVRELVGDRLHRLSSSASAAVWPVSSRNTSSRVGR